MHKVPGVLVVLALAGSLTACGEPQEDMSDVPETPAPAPAPAPSPAPGADSGVGGALPAGVTAAMVQQGQQLYGTVCVACHGQAGAGTQLGPALNDAQWISISGEYDAIVNVIRTGVPQPQQFPNPMPPMGGGNFTDEQLRSLAAYVYSISHGG